MLHKNMVTHYSLMYKLFDNGIGVNSYLDGLEKLTGKRSVSLLDGLKSSKKYVDNYVRGKLKYYQDQSDRGKVSISEDGHMLRVDFLIKDINDAYTHFNKTMKQMVKLVGEYKKESPV